MLRSSPDSSTAAAGYKPRLRGPGPAETPAELSQATRGGPPVLWQPGPGTGWRTGRPPITETRAPSPPAPAAAPAQDPHLDAVLLPDVGPVEGHIVPHH